MATEIHGFVKPGFDSVKDAFAHNFVRDDAYRELGSSLAVYVKGELVVDLHGGWRDAERTIPWTKDTLVNIWSATKGVAALEVAKLVDEGKLDYDALVSDYWPEYGCNGKEKTTVSHLMSHQAGLPGIQEPTTLEEFYNWDTVIGRLEKQAPMWKPGTKNSYHAMTYGFLAGELIRRATGKLPGEYLAASLAGPLDADVYIGLPESEEHRVAPLIPSPLQPPLQSDPAAAPPEAVIAVTNPNMEPTLPHQRAWRAAQIPAGNGHATAIGLARLYGAAANGGTLDGVTLMRPETVEAMCELQTDRVDILLGAPAMWRRGMSGNIMNMYGPLDTTVGHSGWGGSFGCLDIGQGVGIGYVLNQMGDSTVGDPRDALLCDKIFECVM